MSKVLILLLVQIGIAAGLNCYQGQQNNSVSVVGSALTCPQNSMSCIKSVDNATGIATRACQQTTCSFSNTGYQQTTQMQTNNTTVAACQPTSTGLMCCCTGDGCNAAMGTPTTFGVLSLALFGSFLAYVVKF
ncbi:unnamed protein product [Bursaphelenchus xylophilus]|uniref:(pine wood nematode) hypothetical protein n=1 Tax=Bursaphelenchus xylophilus TaxID=6326 RepID=A0A1I7RP53_BURXY|nr:unnamed protein product [Bursaphelenchus xylophilus]CAG9124565.1 unnamed protein product [Bursaphelenchus xylophilus]